MPLIAMAVLWLGMWYVIIKVNIMVKRRFYSSLLSEKCLECPADMNWDWSFTPLWYRSRQTDNFEIKDPYPVINYCLSDC